MTANHKAKQEMNVLLLSSMHIWPSVDETDAKKRPEIVWYYNSTKGGVHSAEEVFRTCNTKAASRQWPIASFFNLLDIVALDTFI